MEANEIRIGNIVEYLGNNEIVDGIDSEYIYLKSCISFDYISHDEVEPIILTEEILLKCGFEKLRKYTFVCNNSLMQLEINVLNGNILHSILAIEIKHLHQLQNLFFALTGKELEINL